MKSIITWILDITFKPPRAVYDPFDTISVITMADGSTFARDNFMLETDNKNSLFGSIWKDNSNPTPSSCLIFLHSLGTNQFECVNLVPFLCSKEMAVASFDFPACGISDGQIIPLDGSGTKEVFLVVDYLKREYNISQFALWGRSLGAAISLHASSISNQFKCVISDSSFSSIEDVLYDQARQNGFNKLFIKMVSPLIKKEAKKSLKIDINNPFPLDQVPFSTTPLLMGHGKLDNFVPLDQAKNLFNNYGCNDKQLYIFEAQHNSARPTQWYETALRFLYHKCNLPAIQRYYDKVYRDSTLHIGPISYVITDLHHEIVLPSNAESPHQTTLEDENTTRQNTSILETISTLVENTEGSLFV